jgi:hypothetical protein
MRKTLLLAALTIACAATVFGQTATVTGFDGKVEYRLAAGE